MIVSAVLQLKTQRLTRSIALASINAGNRKDWIFTLQKLLSDYFNTVYRLNSAFEVHKVLKTELPAGFEELRHVEDRMYSNICLLIDPKRPLHANFYRAITSLRQFKLGEYIDKRDAAISAAQEMFDDEWRTIAAGTE